MLKKLRAQANKVIGQALQSSARGYLRMWLLKLRGIPVANPYYYSYLNYPPSRLRRLLWQIMPELRTHKFNNAIDLGCGNGKHYKGLFGEFAYVVVGVDVNPEGSPYEDLYIKVPADLKGSYFRGMPDNHIEIIFSICLSANGLTDYGDPATRAGRYCTCNNIPRLLKRGGLFIIVDWEREPEKGIGLNLPERFGSLSRVEVGYREYVTYAVYRKEAIS